MWTLAVLMSLSTCGVHEFCKKKFKLVYSFSCPSSVHVNMIYIIWFSQNKIHFWVVIIMKSIKTPNHPAYHWSTLWPLEVWVRGLYNSWWFCVHKLSFIYLSMGSTQTEIYFNKCGTNIYFFFTLQRFGPSPSPNFKS